MIQDNAQELPHWPREYYAPGGGTPVLFYVDTTVPLGRRTYRSGGIPEGLGVRRFGPDDQPEVLASFRQGFLWDALVDQDPRCAKDAAAAESCMVISGTPADDTSLDYLRDVVGALTYFLDNGACAIYDPQMFKWWNPTAWRKRIFTPAAAVPGNHAVILVSDEDDPGDGPGPGKKWYHTRGMRKFGRPDISVHNVPPDYDEVVLALCRHLIERQAYGAIVQDGQTVPVPSLPPGTIMTHAGDLDDPQFNNVHIDVRLGDENGQ